MSTRLRRHRASAAARPASTAPAARRRRPAGRARRARAGRRRVLLLRLHPVEDAPAPGRGAAGGARSAGRREASRTVDVRGRARLARLHGLQLLRRRARSAGWRTTGSTLLRGTGRLAGTGGGRGRRCPAHSPTTIVLATGADPFVPPVPGLRELDGIWTNREVDRHEGRSAPSAHPGRRAGRRRDGAGRAPPRRRGRARRGRRPAARRAKPRRSVEALAEVLRGEEIELHLGAQATRGAPRGRRVRPRVGRRRRASRRPPARRHRPAAARRRTRPRDRRDRDGRPRSPRRRAAPRRASACGRSATSPASGR